ncbi:hypothetical protein [Pseudoalteromonas sp. MMG005]|uniref:hypothetical protein n=1 Tax=Pseudoalteromonas sp. MMG005 TaxID=2822682 RepID=UPI001B3A4A3E|nr:hypothetical protein [Pseudoalteromonas sp. MMG005]MBQ4848333.1 hypothetical protein [Pseudoalteromonas sp. MMG005]
MKRLLQLVLLVVCITVLQGCNTLKRDDYVKTKLLSKAELIPKAEFQFTLNPNTPIDLRGKYSHDRSVDSVNVLYYGTPVTALAQMLSHAALTSSAKEGKLAEQQLQANESVEPIRRTVKSLTNQALLNGHAGYVSGLALSGTQVIEVKPIFFVNQEMTEVSLTLVAWINAHNFSEKKSNRKNQKSKKYHNIIKVHASPITSGEINDTAEGKIKIQAHLSRLFTSAIDSLEKDVSGFYLKATIPQTLHIGQGSKKQFLRGNVLEHSCKTIVVQNLRKWIIRYPSTQITNLEKNCS